MTTRKAVGPHIHSLRDRHLAERWIRRARPAVVKFMSEAIDDSLVDLANSVGSLTIGRVYFPHQAVEGDLADQHLAMIEAAILRHPNIAAWEGVNEAFQGGEELTARARFDSRLMRLCDRHGRKAVIGSFSVGTPELRDWQLYRAALENAAQHGHYVGLHEYGSQALQWGVGKNVKGINNVDRWEMIDPATRSGLEGWFVLRYRKALARWREMGLLSVPRIVITEGGLDRLHDSQAPAGGRGRRGYKEHDPAPGPLGSYARQWAWLCERWSEDPEVVGGVDFGFADASGEWSSFDLSTDPQMLEALIDEMERLEGSEPAPPPYPRPAPPRPDPVELEPRITAAAGVYAIAADGESPAMFAGRAAGHPEASYRDRLELWRQLADHNHLQFDRITAGRAYRLPWFKLEERNR